jgi:hypothetical protein
MRVLRFGYVTQRDEERGHPDRHVDEEDPRPRERLDEQATEHEADGAAPDRDRGPNAERLRALGPFCERRRHDRQCGRRHERGAQPLQPAGQDQQRLAPREGAEERRRGEDHQARQEDALAPDQVAGASAEQQEPAEQEGIRVHDPLEARLGHLEVSLNRRERDVHDRRVWDYHGMNYR